MSLFKEKPKTEREKVEERREEVLAQGRKFKYPMQYAKHKLVINTVLVALIAVILMVVVGWAMLYKIQDTGDMIYRVTQVLPVPVAEVAGEKVRYSDYLMIYRSNLETSERQGGRLGEGEEAMLVRDGLKQAALDAAVEYTYALKLGREMGITVSEEEITKTFDDHRKVGGVERSEEAFLKIISDNFGMNKTEYRRMLYLNLMKVKVAQAVDQHAQELVERVEQILEKDGGNLMAVVDELGGEIEYQDTGQLVDNMNVDGGRSNMAMTLEPGQVSERFLSSNGDGYYYVKLAEKTDTQVNYASVKISFTEFDAMVAELYEKGEVKEYIKIGEENENVVENADEEVIEDIEEDAAKNAEAE